MGEPTCLMRSFSHPSSASRENKEGDPFRALTESISFGRFMSESLAWEKWSTFSHNRYLEEVEQFSKPGSVAQKKAFFEAHYKKRAAMKAAALLEQPNATANCIPEEEMEANNVPEPETTVNSCIPEQEMAVVSVPETEYMNKTCHDSLRGSLSEEATGDTFLDRHEEYQVLEPTYSSDADNLRDAKTERVEEPTQKEQAENLIQVEHLKPVDNVENYDQIAAAPGEKMVTKEAAEKENVALPKNNAERRCRDALVGEAKFSKMVARHYGTGAKQGGAGFNREFSSGRGGECHLSPSPGTAPDNAPFPINKRQMNSSIKSSSQSRASKIPKSNPISANSTQLNRGTNFQPWSKSSTGNSINDKKPTPKSVHFSINLACHSGLTSRDSIKMSKEHSTTAKNYARASINGISKLLPSVSSHPDDKRSRALLNKSLSAGTITGGILQALSGDHAKSSGSKARSPIISCPFSFRSEERAAKRKEFFQKLEEKNNLKTQVKAKVRLTRPQSPKLGGKPSSSVAPETGFQLPRRPSANAENPKRITPRSNQNTIHSVTLLPGKKAHENASPNIQL